MSARTPAIYAVDIAHVRAEPVRHELRHRSYLWFVDLDDLPRHGALAGFESRDHVGDPTRSLRENLDDYLAANGTDLAGGRITMLTNARSLGYVFNPLSLYWCHDRAGDVVCVVAEVHNTYGQRHRYLLRTDDAGRADTAKQFYVSPFYPVDGSYRMSVPEPGETLAVTIALHRPDSRPFTASVRGVRRAATRRAVLANSLRHPLETWRVRALITKHGIALWRKGLPIQPRPAHPSDPEAGMPTKSTVADRLAALVHDSVGIDLPVRIRAWDGSEAGPKDGPVLVIRSRRALRQLLWAPGELGLARAYVTGELDVDGDLADGLRRAWTQARSGPTTGIPLSAGAKAKAALAAAKLGAIGSRPTPPASEARLTGRLHSRLRDRAAISHHYDLSNDFYALLLDESMAYSSAYYTHEGQSLADAQRAKLDLICRKLDLKPGMRLLDVGCGWGSLVLHAAEHYAVEATGITLSAQQRDHTVKRIADRGLADRVEVRLQDYRELADTGEQFDAVSSIEMGEHVGEGQYPVYAGILHSALKPTGRLLLQQMSRHQDTAPGGGAFIEAYIAPDMHMRPMARTLAHLQDAGFEIRDVEAMREHYVTTVEQWIETFESKWDQFVGLVGEEVARVWRLYLVGGALTFEEGRMGVDQFLAVKATADGRSGMPATRPWAVGNVSAAGNTSR
ncbi:MAG: cyclopropane-fatty-acyl-phospholipid synthase [Pseudonocardiales bacterium]|nr:cyclopropane-fatty-acyl-phospholipid synthase [Pseudonocardiales bacterium]